MAREKKLEKNLILAEVTDAWAKRHGLAEDPYLRGLIRALTEKANLAMWASLNPFDLLPHPTSRRGNRFEQIARVITFWRNGLVFAPVAITWLAVGQATTAFERYVDENINATVNFLQFWQNGYGVLADVWRIGKVAMFDAAIVGLVIVMTFGINYFLQASLRLREIEETELEHERAELALAIKEYLYSKQNVTRLTLNQGIATAVENLVEATEKLQRRRRR